jgi:malic enzyme
MRVGSRTFRPEAFVRGVREVFPHAILQWEDFHKDRAFVLLERYRRRIVSFNQRRHSGHSLRVTKQRMAGQRVVFVGAGAARTGIARLCANAMRADGADDATIRGALVRTRATCGA